METYCADKFDKFDKIDNNNLKMYNYRLLSTYLFIDFYRFPIQLTKFYRFYQLLSIIDLTSRATEHNQTSGEWAYILLTLFLRKLSGNSVVFSKVYFKNLPKAPTY